MFPNVRLMIAATLASVVALVCGFGMFAVFRVSHEPFVRPPAGTASLQLVAANAVYASAGFAAGGPLDQHLQVEAEPSAAATTDTPAATDEHEAETAAAPASELRAAAPGQASSEAGEATEQPAAAAAPTSEVPAAGADSASANDDGNVEASSRSEATFATTTGAAETASAPNTTAVASDQEINAAVVSIADTGPAFSTAAIAVIERQFVPPPPGARVNSASAPADAASPSGEREHKTASRKPKRARVMARRVRPVTTFQYAASQYAQTQYPPTTEQNFGGTQANFQMTSPLQAQYFATPAAPVRYVRVVARKPKAPNKGPNTAIGGPFVSATSR
jgi:hypothetical protein